MSSELLKLLWVKATNREEGAPRHSANWLLSRRGWLRIYTDRLECGDWVIPAVAVTSAKIYRLLLGHVLVVRTAAGTFQFGLNPWIRMPLPLPFAAPVERGKLGYSPFSIAIRVALIIWLLYVLLR